VLYPHARTDKLADGTERRSPTLNGPRTRAQTNAAAKAVVCSTRMSDTLARMACVCVMTSKRGAGLGAQAGEAVATLSAMKMETVVSAAKVSSPAPEVNLKNQSLTSQGRWARSSLYMRQRAICFLLEN